MSCQIDEAISKCIRVLCIAQAVCFIKSSEPPQLFLVISLSCQAYIFIVSNCKTKTGWKQWKLNYTAMLVALKSEHYFCVKC